MKTWFTSDTHFGHWKISEYCNRPFKTLEEMNNTLIKNWNERVKPEDLVFFLGDWCFKNSPGGKQGDIHNAHYYKSQLNGDVVFIKGNHCANNSLKTKIERVVIKYGGYRVNLVHNPMHIDATYDFNLVGHVHGAWTYKKMKQGYSLTNVINVGVDVWGFKPVSFEELLRGFRRWERTMTKTSQNCQPKNEEKNSVNG